MSQSVFSADANGAVYRTYLSKLSLFSTSTPIINTKRKIVQLSYTKCPAEQIKQDEKQTNAGQERQTEQQINEYLLVSDELESISVCLTTGTITKIGKKSERKGQYGGYTFFILIYLFSFFKSKI